MKANFFSRREIAESYFPDLAPTQAVRRLSAILNHEQPLADRLKNLGYKPSKQWLTPRQVDAIFYYLGTPWICNDSLPNGLYPIQQQNWDKINSHTQ